MEKNIYPTEPHVKKGELPDLFLPPGAAGRISRPEQWPAAAEAWRRLVVSAEYGGLPPAPESVEVETLCRASVRRFPGEPRLWSFRVNCLGGTRPFSFTARMLFPAVEGKKFPVIIHGDGCWWYLSDEVARKVVESGCALLMFNRTEMAEDLGYAGVPDRERRAGGLYEVYPGLVFGALSAWAWGYHRCVDLLETLPFADPGRVAVTGHSRGGKTALLAGATDPRISLVNDNASCAAGAAPFRYVGDRGETLDIVERFPSWFGPELSCWLGREEEMPFDQHCLLATLAPRPLLLTYALDDRWSNPEGMVQCFRAAREAYHFLGASGEIAFHLRPGKHAHTLEDWEALLDFLGPRWLGRESRLAFNRHPYDHLEPAFSWRAPGAAGK